VFYLRLQLVDMHVADVDGVEVETIISLSSL
jgi:hypothetical protein